MNGFTFYTVGYCDKAIVEAKAWLEEMLRNKDDYQVSERKSLQHNIVRWEREREVSIEIDRLCVTLTATENALEEIVGLANHTSYDPEFLLAGVIEISRNALAAARVVVSADPPEEGRG